MAHKNERVELEMQILKYRQIARQMAANPEDSERIKGLVAELEQKLREIDAVGTVSGALFHRCVYLCTYI